VFLQLAGAKGCDQQVGRGPKVTQTAQLLQIVLVSDAHRRKHLHSKGKKSTETMTKEEAEDPIK
jgi:hypothetical protein